MVVPGSRVLMKANVRDFSVYHKSNISFAMRVDGGKIAEIPALLSENVIK